MSASMGFPIIKVCAKIKSKEFEPRLYKLIGSLITAMMN